MYSINVLLFFEKNVNICNPPTHHPVTQCLKNLLADNTLLQTWVGDGNSIQGRVSYDQALML